MPKRDLALARRSSHHYDGVKRHGARDELGRWIEMAQRSPMVPRLRV
jgi:hypothetical protein